MIFNTVKLSVACVWVIYNYDLMVFHSKFVFWTNDCASARLWMFNAMFWTLDSLCYKW